MRAGVSIRSGQVIARSLKITRATSTLVAAVTAAVALNAMVAMQFIGSAGQIALLALVFISLAIGSLAVSVDVYSRSSQAVANLRSIGASKGSISSALAVAVVGYGAVGAVLGAAVGGVTGLALGGGWGVSLLAESVGVIAVASGATAIGFYVGARRAWPS